MSAIDNLHFANSDAPAKPMAPPRPRLAPTVVLIAASLLAAAATAAFLAGGARMAALALIGAALGLALHHSSFGFTAGYRALLRDGHSAQVRAQLLLLGLAVLFFAPALAVGSVLGQPVRGFVFPIGLELAIGAFLFGVGMQIANGCGSGALYAAGGGSARMIVTLAAFVGGATLAAFTFELWSGLPRLDAVSIPAALGPWGGLVAQLGVIGSLWWVLHRVEQARHGRVEPIMHAQGVSSGAPSLLRGGWSYAAGAAALAALCFLTLVIVGRPWGITQAFALWGSWGVERAGLDDPHFWPFWEDPTRVEFLSRAAFADVNTVMNLGLVLGAMLAAGLSGRFAFNWRLAPRQYLAAVVGGLLLGFGAIMATGCNISAFVSGVASGSLHGWIWLLAALPGNAIGMMLRPLFGDAR